LKVLGAGSNRRPSDFQSENLNFYAEHHATAAVGLLLRNVYVLAMAIQGNGYELVGMSLSGGPLTEPVHIELDSGMTALYGENGAGKTWLLRLMSSALTGVALERAEGEAAALADLHLRLNSPQLLPTGTFLEGLAANLGASVIARRGELLQTDPDDLDPSPYRDEINERGLRPDVWSRIALLIDMSPDTHSAPQEIGPTLYESAEKGLVTLSACGSAKLPAWDVFLAGAVRHGENFPDLLRQKSEAWFNYQREHEAALSGPARGLDEWQEMLTTLSEADPLMWASIGPYLPFPRAGHIKSAPRAHHEAWPDWLQVPVLPLGEALAVSPVQVLGSDERPREFDTDTLVHVLGARPVTTDPDGRRTVPAAIVGNDSNGPVFGEEVAGALERVQLETAANLHDVLPGAPAMRFHMGSIEEWLHGVRPVWQFLEVGTGDWLPIRMLSSAQERWARLAIGLASAPGYGLPVVFFCDEPETGLHRLAERRLAIGLQNLALRTGVSVLAATHSPLLLDANQVRPVLVRRDPQGAVAISEVPLSVLNRLEAERSAGQLGLSVGDLLSLMRLAVVVEGLHDEMVFTWLLRGPLDRALATILPLHGARHAASLADARLLFDGTDAQILVVLDNLEHHEVDEVWMRTTALAADGDLDGARACLDELRLSKSSERLFLHQLGLRALEVGRMDRIHIHGLNEPDVICYLPPELLLHKAKPWSELIGSWQRDSGLKPPTNLKKWLRTNHYLPSDQAEIDAAVQNAAVTSHRDGLLVHPDLVELGLRIEDLGSSSGFQERPTD
jgi:ABC-type transport system involved in cytochrome c biogenesis ATPase subunit